MGIRKGTKLTIPAHSKGKVDTFCMDFTLDAPTSGTTYKKILSNPSAARVKFQGEPTKSLQAALDAGEMAIEGMSMTFEAFLENLDNPGFRSRFTGEELETLDEIKTFYQIRWNELTQVQKNEINSGFAQYGDHTGMQLVNMRSKEVRISFDDHAILGVDDTIKMGSIDASLLSDGNQAELWLLRNKENQGKLKALGFYDGGIDGAIGPKTKKAIKNFQAQQGLDPTGKIDSETDQLLEKLAAKKIQENKGVQEYLRDNGNYDGKIDGVLGEKARQSIAEFKAKHGLHPYDVEMGIGRKGPHMKFNNQDDFLTYYKNLDEDCSPELCLSDDAGIFFANGCFPGSFSVSPLEGLTISIEVGAVTYDLKIVDGDGSGRNEEGCQLSRSACFSKTMSREYSVQCEKDGAGIEVSATQASISNGNLSVSLFK